MHSNLKNNSGISTFNLQLNQISLKLASAHFIRLLEKKPEAVFKKTNCLNIWKQHRLQLLGYLETTLPPRSLRWNHSGRLNLRGQQGKAVGPIRRSLHWAAGNALPAKSRGREGCQLIKEVQLERNQTGRWTSGGRQLFLTSQQGQTALGQEPNLGYLSLSSLHLWRSERQSAVSQPKLWEILLLLWFWAHEHKGIIFFLVYNCTVKTQSCLLL